MSTTLLNFHKHVRIRSGSKADVSDGSFGANGLTEQAGKMRLGDQTIGVQNIYLICIP